MVKFRGFFSKRLSALLAEAQAAQTAKNWKAAYESYLKAAALSTNRFGLLVQLGHMSKEMEAYDVAERHYNEALALRPDDLDLNIQLGHFFNRRGDEAQAEDWYRKALRIDPAQEDLARWIRDIERKTAGEGAALRRREALAVVNSHQWDKALPLALATFYKDGVRDFDVIVGHVYRELGQYADALTFYRMYLDRCIEDRSPALPDAYLRVAQSLQVLGHARDEIDFLIKAKNELLSAARETALAETISTMLNAAIRKQYPVFL